MRALLSTIAVETRAGDATASLCVSRSRLARKVIPAAVKDFVSYDPQSGTFHRVASKHERYIGAIVPFVHPDGYVMVYADGVKYAAHRLAWFLTFGEQPDYIDHKNGNRADNRLVNLRCATGNQNAFNRRAGKSHLPKGVSFHKARGKFQAQMRAFGQSRYLGLFDTALEAGRAYDQAVADIHAEFARPS